VLFYAALWAQSAAETEVADPAELSSSVTNGPDGAQEAKAFFDELIGGQLRQEHLAGATVSVVEDGRLVFAEGYADLESREPVVAEETLFYPGSIGKLFTWTAVMQLAEEGKLDLDVGITSGE
jgi:CubicO group peptidase (beta-lactamase class C family)